MDGEIPNEENPAGASGESYRAALDQIRKAYAAGGSELRRSEVVQFVKSQIWLGYPESSSRATGRPPKVPLTQYKSKASAWRRNAYHRLVRNPTSAKAGGAAMREATLSTRDLIFKFAAGLSMRVRKPQRAQKIMADCARIGKPKSLSTVQRVLREFDKKAGSY
jgi:hypothetical protein